MNGKFRVWDKENKEWAIDFLISCDGQLITEDNSLFIRDHFIIQFFTGLQDKRGRDIYEGDIIYHENLNAKLTCRYSIDDYCGFEFYDKDGEFAYREGDDIVLENCGIIGNIYENDNPELLK